MAVARKDTGGTPDAMAVTDCVPATVPSAHWTDAMPSAAVDSEVVDNEPDPVAGKKSTRTPWSGAPSVAIARTAMGSGRGEPAVLV
jgi:hypothetical protein